MGATTPVLVVLQARMGSTRLPGKVLRSLAGHTLLSHCVRRLVAADVGPVVVATTRRPEDDAVVDEARRLGVAWARGADSDVLQRFALVADVWGAETVVRATADNPAVDVEAPGRVLQWMAAGADYVVEDGLPVGAAVEVVRRSALDRAHRAATSAYDREHVTPFVKARPDEFRIERPVAPPALRRPDVRLTIDTRSDLKFMERVLEAAAGDATLVPLAGIIERAARLTRPLEES
jgi:spore coat polysaccharide biosynthesis protein SpsF